MSDIKLSYFFLPDYRTGDSRSSAGLRTPALPLMKALRTRRSSTRRIIYHCSSSVERLSGRGQRDDRDDGDNGIYTHGHPHTAPPNNESYSDENSTSDGAATDDECTPPTGHPGPWRNSTAKAIIIKALKDEASDIHLFIGALAQNIEGSEF